MPLIRRQLVLSPVAFVVASAAARAQVAVNREPIRETAAAQSLAPSGVLRVAINLGNGVLAQRNAQGELTGISVILARALAERLKLPSTSSPLRPRAPCSMGWIKGFWTSHSSP